MSNCYFSQVSTGALVRISFERDINPQAVVARFTVERVQRW